MAKSKHSIALFEVVQTAKRQNRSTSDMLRTPKWWFKAKPKMPSACPTPEPALRLPEPVMVETASSVPAPRAPGVDLKLDPDRQRITFHVSYTSAAVTAFSIIVVLTMAYVVGNHMANGPSHAVAGLTTDQLRLAAARPEVMNVKAEPVKNTSSEVVPMPAVDPAEKPADAPAVDVETASRFVGRNYVVMQIYKDQKTAEDVAKRLTDAHLPCSVTRGLEGYSNDSWFCVVGLTGFEKMSGNTDFKKYLAAVVLLNDKWSAADAKFKRLEPQTYKWKT